MKNETPKIPRFKKINKILKWWALCKNNSTLNTELCCVTESTVFYSAYQQCFPIKWQGGFDRTQGTKGNHSLKLSQKQNHSGVCENWAETCHINYRKSSNDGVIRFLNNALHLKV